MKAIIYNNSIVESYIPGILTEIYKEKVYSPFLKGKKDLIIMDCGANIGLTTSYFSGFAKKIYSIEPSKQHFKVLKEMVRYNDLGDKVTLIRKAIAMENGTELFYHNDNITAFSLKREVDTAGMSSEKVETIRFDTLFEEYGIDHIDFLKLDIEGSEIEVVGGKGFENIADKIDSLLVEYHKWSGRNPSQLVTTLIDYGFDMFSVKSDTLLFGGRRKK